RFIAEDMFSGSIPTGDNALQIFADDGIVAGFDNGGKLASAGLGAFAPADLALEGLRTLLPVGVDALALILIGQHVDFTCNHGRMLCADFQEGIAFITATEVGEWI